MTCPICLDAINNEFKTECCKQSFCYSCYFKACTLTGSCSLCRSEYHINKLINEFNGMIENIKNYRSNRVSAFGVSRIKKRMMNDVFNFYRKNDFLFENKDIIEYLEKNYFEIKCLIGWKEWKEFDNLMNDYNLNRDRYIVDMLN